MELLSVYIFAGALIYAVGKLLIEQAKERKYQRLTGRKGYQTDMNDFKRSYHELIKYFKPNIDAQMQELAPMRWQDANGIILGKQGNKLAYIPADKLKNGKNMLVFGTPGSGKTSTIAKCSIKQLSQEQTSLVVINVKGDMESGGITEGRKIKHFNPTNPQKSCHFNPLAGVAEMSNDERKNYLASLASILIPPQTSENGAYFVNCGRKYLIGIAEYYLAKDANITFPAIAQGILQGNCIDWVKLAMQEDAPPGMKEQLCAFFQQNEKNLAGGYDVTCDGVRPFVRESLAELLTDAPDCISAQDLEKGTDIFIDLELMQVDTFAPLTTLIVEQIISQLLTHRCSDINATDEQRRNIVFVLDEFPRLSVIPSLHTLLSCGRSFGISLLMLMQELSQLDAKYGKEGRQSIVGCSTTFCFANLEDVDTRKWASELIGKQKSLQTSNSLEQGKKNQHRTCTEHLTPIFEPEFFSSLASKKQMIIYHEGKYLLADKVFYFE